MKLNNNKTSIIVVCIIIVFLIIIGLKTVSLAMQSYYKVDFQTGLVTASTLNVRSGPGTGYRIVGTAKKGDYIRVFAGIGNWYVVQIEGDEVGVVSKQYVKPIYPNTGSNNKSGNNTNDNSGASQGENNAGNVNSDEQEIFNLINEQRISNGIRALNINNEVQRVARIKAQDMVNNNYFSHTSPTYGSPFDMLNSFKISYKTAGENIAGNSSNSEAVTSWMNSPGHRANILNENFNYTGIGVVRGSQYGKIFVQMFIGK